MGMNAMIIMKPLKTDLLKGQNGYLKKLLNGLNLKKKI